MNPKYIVALELSGSQVKGALASISKVNEDTFASPTIDAIVTEDDTECVQYGRVQNVVNAAKYTNLVLQKLQESPIITDGTINGAYVALAGRSLSSEKVSADITLPSEMVITADIIKKLCQEAAKLSAPNRQVLKVLPRKFIVDSQPMINPEGVLGRKLHGDFTLVTCNPTNQRNLDLVAADRERISLTVKDYVVAPLAVAEMTLDEESKQLGCVLVDIGYQTITISIYKDRALQYLATLPMGAHNITRDISIGLNWTMEKAEKLKCTQGDASPEPTRNNDEITRMNAYVAARAYEIVANINANIDYAGYKASDLPGGFILVGRGAYLHNFDNLLASQSKMRVRLAKVPSNINFGPDVRNIHAEDFMSLIAIILHICRKSDFKSCVTFPVKQQEPEEVTLPPQPVKPVYQEPVQKPANNEIDEENWYKDDEEKDETKKPEKKENRGDKKADKRPKKTSILERLQDKWGKILGGDDLENDTVI